MFKATYKDLYKKKGNDGTVRTVFRYLLGGSEKDIARYKAILEEQGIPVYEDEKTGKIVYFDTVYRGPVCQVVITDSNRIVVANNQLDFLQSQLVLATDPALKQALATAIANQIVANTLGTAISAPTASASAPVDAVTEEEANLEE